MYLGYCALHLTLLFKLNSFFSLGLLSPGIHNGRGKKLTNNYMQIKRFFFCCQGNLKHFLENYRFCRKSGNDAYSKRWRCHAICVNMTHDALRTKINMWLTSYGEKLRLKGFNDFPFKSLNGKEFPRCSL